MIISFYHWYVIISVPPRRIADLLYHAAVSADNDIHGEYGAVVAVPGKKELKSGFLIGSMRSRGGVCGPSPIWPKFGPVVEDTPKTH